MRVRLPLYTCNSTVIDNRFGYSVQHDRIMCYWYNAWSYHVLSPISCEIVGVIVDATDIVVIARGCCRCSWLLLSLMIVVIVHDYYHHSWSLSSLVITVVAHDHYHRPWSLSSLMVIVITYHMILLSSLMIVDIMYYCRHRV